MDSPISRLMALHPSQPKEGEEEDNEAEEADAIHQSPPRMFHEIWLRCAHSSRYKSKAFRLISA